MRTVHRNSVTSFAIGTLHAISRRLEWKPDTGNLAIYTAIIPFIPGYMARHATRYVSAEGSVTDLGVLGAYVTLTDPETVDGVHAGSLVLRDHVRANQLARQSGLYGSLSLSSPGVMRVQFENVLEIRSANRSAGYFFFSPSTMGHFRSRIGSKLYGERFFITSEAPYEDGERFYTARVALATGDVFTVEGYSGETLSGFRSMGEAQRALREYSAELTQRAISFSRDGGSQCTATS